MDPWTRLAELEDQWTLLCSWTLAQLLDGDRESQEKALRLFGEERQKRQDGLREILEAWEPDPVTEH